MLGKAPGLKSQASKSNRLVLSLAHHMQGPSKVSGSTRPLPQFHCPIRCKSGWEHLSLGLLMSSPNGPPRFRCCPLKPMPFLVAK